MLLVYTYIWLKTKAEVNFAYKKNRGGLENAQKARPKPKPKMDVQRGLREE